ncbi:predicted protein [Naegleria gruberi]|uniref:Predicted protein n=1 Tax=Naegleria gruberi TaxID=5762 RepID=D2V4Y4_NAEGR|nr:uncharacterized protein NAEGRDRAFT_46746 [Naegleria gruberi]EFC48012.1 predicted protein [Naegleria gruberi]|eukprot:XP_002680756.1 predicted protein [Naegleria gruberi strain NEG-M]
MNNRHNQHPTPFAPSTRPADLENTTPLFQKQQLMGNSTGPIKPNILQPQQQQQQLKKGGNDSSAASNLKRKALVDITNTQKGANLQQNNPLQPAKKKIKSNPIQVFNDNPNSNKSQQALPQPIKPKNILSQQLGKKIVSTLKSNPLKLTFDDNEIEYCPQSDEVFEHPTPVFSEFNLQTGQTEDIFVTLSDERMKEITKPPTCKPGSFLSFDVLDSITTTPSSPSPQPLSPIAFDDIFNFEVL